VNTPEANMENQPANPQDGANAETNLEPPHPTKQELKSLKINKFPRLVF